MAYGHGYGHGHDTTTRAERLAAMGGASIQTLPSGEGHAGKAEGEACAEPTTTPRESEGDAE